MWPLFLLWDMGLSSIVIQVFLGLIGLDLIFRFWKKKIYYVKVHDFSKGHSWCSITDYDLAICCSLCSHVLLAEGMRCDSCGICADQGCMKRANKKLKCKPVSLDSISMRHHWVKGNLSESTCHVCEEDCGNNEENNLSDFRCCWCQWTVHEKCQANLSDLCNLGVYRNFIIPPNCIKLKTRGRLRSQCLVSSIREPQWGNSWKPLIVIGNAKSGSNEACHILSSARSIFNAVQAIDLSDQEPKVALQLCSLLRETQCRLLIAGGDGTIAWVLNAVQELQVKHLPETAVLPLGTGNDLSRALGWGPHIEGEVDLRNFLMKLNNATSVSMDRWVVDLRPSRHLGIRFSPARSIRFNNYFSIGVDARVALNFHETRQSPMYLFSHRLFNKLIYFTYGTKDVVEESCKGMERITKLYIDDKLVELPPVQALVFLNIDSWGAGIKPWNMGQGGPLLPECLLGDGMMEVMGVSSSFHIAQMQVGLSEPLRLGRGKSFRILLSGSLPVQADGEPWEQGPSEITIQHAGQVPMLKNNNC